MSEHTSPHEALRWSFNDQQTLGENIKLTNEARLGRGSQGEVLPAEDAEGHKYAVKVQAVAGEDASPDVQKASAAFRREGEILMKLRHPNIIHAYSTGVHRFEGIVRGRDGSEFFSQTTFFDYILMDRAEYGSIADYIGKLKKDPELPPDHPRRLSPALSAAIILQTAEGLRHAHAEQDMEPNQPDPIIHSDINIRNIVLGAGKKGMKVMIADFGVSHGGDGETVLGAPLHAFSPFFASPRQIETGAVGVLDDVYSLAVTGYYLLSGEPPITPQHTHDAKAHRTQKIPPIKPASMEGREIVEELEVTLLTGMDRDEKRRFSSMGEFQADAKEGLARAETRAAKNKTYFDLATVIVDNQATTWPQKLLGAELPKVEDSAAASQADIPKPEAEAPNAIPDTETEIVPNPTDTKKFRVPLKRRKILWGLGGLAATAVAGGGIWLNEHNSPKIETPAERAEREKLDQERQAITGFAYEVVDFLNKNNHDSDVPDVLREIIPYDPEGVVPHIEQVFANYSGAAAALLASYLVPYNPAGATKLMQGYLSHQKYKEALMVATRLASFSRTPAGKDGNWEAEVQNVRKTVTNAVGDKVTERQDADKILNAALNPKDPAAAIALQDFDAPQYESWAVEVLAAAIAPHNSAAVGDELRRRIDGIKNLDGNDLEHACSMIEVIGRSLAPYAPDVVAECIVRLDATGQTTNSAYDAQQRLAVALVPYKPEATVAYVKGGSEDPNKWQTHRWNMTTLVALAKVNPGLVMTMRSHITSSPFIEWIDASLTPLDATARAKALDVLPTSNGLYLGDSKYVLDALLRSRQPKAQ